jgi:hypothetical protein
MQRTNSLTGGSGLNMLGSEGSLLGGTPLDLFNAGSAGLNSLDNMLGMRLSAGAGSMELDGLLQMQQQQARAAQPAQPAQQGGAS